MNYFRDDEFTKSKKSDKSKKRKDEKKKHHSSSGKDFWNFDDDAADEEKSKHKHKQKDHKKSKKVLLHSEWDEFKPAFPKNKDEKHSKPKKKDHKSESKDSKPKTGKYYSSALSEVVKNLSPDIRKIVEKSIGDHSKDTGKTKVYFNRYFTGEWKSLTDRNSAEPDKRDGH